MCNPEALATLVTAAERKLPLASTVADAAEVLCERPELLRALLAQLSCALWTTDNDLRFTSSLGCGNAARAWPARVDAGSALVDHYPTNHALLAAHRQALAGKTSVFQEEVAGELYRIRVQPLVAPSGTTAGCLGMAWEVSERNRAAQRLPIPSLDIVVVANQAGYFLEVSKSFEHITGFSREELLAIPFLDFVHPEDRDSTTRAVETLARGNDIVYFENRYRCRDGTYRWLAWTCPAPCTAAKLMYASARDITDWRHIREEQQRLVVELARSNADLEQYAYVASHDLQEPLRAVAGCVQVLQKRYQGQLDARADELIQHTVEGVTRMETLINDLLAYSRVTKPGQGRGTANLEVVLANVLANLQSSIQQSEAMISHDSLPTISADEGQISQLLSNLLMNAIKFRGPEAPRIHLGAKREKAGWLFSLQDNGIGIEPGYFERIFLLFQRLHTRAEYPGTGIGLAICKKIVERHGGKIWVESQAGAGTTFCFTIPDSEETR